jgi:hypothetical protein
LLLLLFLNIFNNSYHIIASTLFKEDFSGIHLENMIARLEFFNVKRLVIIYVSEDADSVYNASRLGNSNITDVSLINIKVDDFF